MHRVSPLLHTPLMSLTNAISAISVVGAHAHRRFEKDAPHAEPQVLGCIAVTAPRINVVAGFLITDRMLKMFRSASPAKGDKPLNGSG